MTYNGRMLYPTRITFNSKNVLRFSVPREIRSAHGWTHDDLFIAFPKDVKHLAIQRFSATDDNICVDVEEAFKGLVYGLYVVKKRTHIQLEIPARLSHLFHWTKERILVAKEENENCFLLRSITKI